MYSRYPYYLTEPELRCGCSNNRSNNRCNNKTGQSGGCGGCSGQCYPNNVKLYDTSKMIPGVAYKNGVPYNCACNLVQAPYSMPYESIKCPSCQPPYQAACHPMSNKCKCHRRASIYNNNNLFEENI